VRPRGACVAIVLFGALLAWKAWVPQVGQPAPEFELKTLAGGQASLSALRGVFVDSSGVVRAVHSGPMTHESLDQDLATILPRP